MTVPRGTLVEAAIDWYAITSAEDGASAPIPSSLTLSPLFNASFIASDIFIPIKLGTLTSLSVLFSVYRIILDKG